MVVEIPITVILAYTLAIHAIIAINRHYQLIKDICTINHTRNVDHGLFINNVTKQRQRSIIMKAT